MDYAVPLFFIGLVATAFGQWGTDYLIQKVSGDNIFPNLEPRKILSRSKLSGGC